MSLQCLTSTQPQLAYTTAKTYQEEFQTSVSTGGAAGTEALAAGTVVIRFKREGEDVRMYVPQRIAETKAAATISFATALPARFRPATTVKRQIVGHNNRADTVCVVTVTDEGVVTIGNGITGANYTNSEPGGWRAFSIDWNTSL